MFSDIPLVQKSADQGHPEIKTKMADIGQWQRVVTEVKFLCH